MKFKLLLVILWMTIIFCFSNQPAEDSSKLSNGFINKVIVNAYRIFDNNMTKEKENQILEKYSMPIRKLAHFTIYFILGILIFILLKDYNIKHIIIYSLLVCFIYSCTDEIHQYFIPGRYSSFIDILIDTFGSYIGILLIYIPSCKRSKKII